MVVCVSTTCYAESSYAPEAEPATVERHGCEEAAPTCAPEHTATVALPPPLTIAYKDPCHPCCANCMTYSNLHIDNDGDDAAPALAAMSAASHAAQRSFATRTGTRDLWLCGRMVRDTATGAVKPAAATITSLAAATTNPVAAVSHAATTSPVATNMSPAAATTNLAAATTNLAAAITNLAAMNMNTVVAKCAAMR
ncbi:hypothetical protein GGI25_000057 [Coemansia spiralis]|uniref:Uncharacterized protein n=1 Tax=Coemansia spiralis TaxID=417178 RepID=A0A9W8L1D6_9FUNG|nr:hypothetical protein GGI25_000057 [Coemansia spiralis]